MALRKQQRTRQAFGAALLAMATVAGSQAAAATSPWHGLTPLSDAELASMRGGFVAGGLKIDFSFENLVRVNGELQAHTVLRMPSMDEQYGGIPRMEVYRRPDEGGLAAVLRSNRTTDVGVLLDRATGGDGTNAVTSISADGIQTLIQNNLDNQTIQNLKIANIDISNLGSVRDTGRALQSQIESSIVQSLR